MDTNCVVSKNHNSYHCCGCEETTDETVLSSISGSGTVVGDYNNNSTTCHVLSDDDEENSISSTSRGKVVPCADDDPAAASRTTAGGNKTDCCDGGGGMRLKMNHEQQQQRPTTIKKSPEESFYSDVDEETGLLMVVPKEEKYDATTTSDDGPRHCHHHRRSASPAGIVDFEIGSVRSHNSDDETTEVELNDSEKYLASGVLARALPERLCALVVTLAVEIPVLFMISGGSERLCMLIGRRRYQLMMAFLPLTSAISGNCGLQGSTLTTRAVSHMHVTKNSYVPWLMTEIAVSAVLGINMGVLLGLFAYVASGNDFAFGCTIFFAQFTSILTAGLTGTMAPLIFQFIFGRDSGKWGGPLETAVQDIVGSFAMVVLSYRILVVLGPTEIDPDDICGIK